MKDVDMRIDQGIQSKKNIEELKKRLKKQEEKNKKKKAEK